jgi:TM2 domain-containing membrane protein YozV
MSDEMKPDTDSRAPAETNKKTVAGILAILLGGFGAHKFYLGIKKPAIIMLIANIVTCFTVMWIVGVIEGIMYLTKSDDEFMKVYQEGKKEWF